MTTNNNTSNIQADGGVISLDGGLALSEYTGSTVSDFMGYGSYSGADISVLVHYPKTVKLQQVIKRKRDAIQSDLIKLEKEQSFTGSKKNDTLYTSRLASLQDQLRQLDIEEESIKDLPSSKKLAEIHTLSWSTFRENTPVRTLGSIFPRSYVKGSRTIAGSMIFTVFHQHVLHEVLALNLGVFNTGTSDHDPYKNSTNLPDQLPPLDMTIVFANEYGALSEMGLYGVQFFQEGSTFSIEDIFSESVLQYNALDIDPIRIAGSKKLDGHGVSQFWSETGSGLPYSMDDPVAYRIRRNPFI